MRNILYPTVEQIKMAKYVHSKDKKVHEALLKELEHFQELVKGHAKLIQAIGEL